MSAAERSCARCRPALILCCCGYEERGKRRIRRPLPDEALSPAARGFRWLRGLMDGLTPASRRRVSELARLAAAVEAGPSQEDQDAAEALRRTIRTRDDGRDGCSAVRWAERRFLALYLGEWIGELWRRAEEAADPPQAPDPRPGFYYVSAVGGAASNAGHRDPGLWLVAGPYGTHAEAIGLVDAVRLHACGLDSRGSWLAWGTARREAPDSALLGPWRPPAAAGGPESPSARSAPPRGSQGPPRVRPGGVAAP